MILALDTGTKTGWALIDGGKVIESGVQDFSKKRGESNGGMFLRFRRWLIEIAQDEDGNTPNLLVYEQAHHRGGAATEICVNLTGRVQEVAATLNIEVAAYHTAHLKKWATGKGRADKDAMIKRAEVLAEKKVEDDNEADAILCGLMAWEDYGA